MSMLFILDPVDKVVFTWINYDFSHPWLDPIMIFLSSKWTFIPAYVFILYLYFNRFGKRIWIPVLLTVAAFGLADSVSSRVLKPLTKRTRPVFEESMNAPIAEKPVRLPHEKPGSRYVCRVGNSHYVIGVNFRKKYGVLCRCCSCCLLKSLFGGALSGRCCIWRITGLYNCSVIVCFSTK